MLQCAVIALQESMHLKGVHHTACCVCQEVSRKWLLLWTKQIVQPVALGHTHWMKEPTTTARANHVKWENLPPFQDLLRVQCVPKVNTTTTLQGQQATFHATFVHQGHFQMKIGQGASLAKKVGTPTQP